MLNERRHISIPKKSSFRIRLISTHDSFLSRLIVYFLMANRAYVTVWMTNSLETKMPSVIGRISWRAFKNEISSQSNDWWLCVTFGRSHSVYLQSSNLFPAQRNARWKFHHQPNSEEEKKKTRSKNKHQKQLRVRQMKKSEAEKKKKCRIETRGRRKIGKYHPLSLGTFNLSDLKFAVTRVFHCELSKVFPLVFILSLLGHFGRHSRSIQKFLVYKFYCSIAFPPPGSNGMLENYEA